MALEALGEGEVGVKISKDAGRPGGGVGATTWRSFSLDKALGPSTSQEEVFRQVSRRSSVWGSYSFVVCLRHVAIGHASSRRSTVPTPNRGASNNWAIINVSFMYHIKKRLAYLVSCVRWGVGGEGKR